MVKLTNPAAAKLFLANSQCSGRDRLKVAEHGFSLRYTDPAAMLAWCEAAAVNLPPSLPEMEAALLLAHLGNAYRVSCNFREAELHLRRALAAAPTEPLILEFYASLMKDRRQLHKASSFLRRAATLRRGSSDNPALAATLLESALVFDESGYPVRATGGALSALDIIGVLPPTEERERLARVAFQNLATYLVNAGKAEKALWLVRLCREKLMAGGEIARLKTEWLMAEVVGALGEIDSAIASYEEIRKRFAELRQSQEVALVTLDLARLLLKPQPVRAREEALSVEPILDSLGIPPNAHERKLLAKVVKTGSEAALVQLAAALRANALARRSPRTSPTVPGPS